MKKSIIVSLVFFIAFAVKSQDIIIEYIPLEETPLIDGQIEAVWNNHDTHALSIQDVNNMSPVTLNNAGWKVAWNDTSLYSFLK